jgi:hypothetical protein
MLGMAKRTLTERLVRRVYYKYFARNVLFELQIRARTEAADYVQAHMPDALVFEDGDKLLIDCLRKSAPGAILEFGVAGGKSITTIAQAVSQPVYGFDSFEGLPEDWAGHGESRGAFSQKGKPPKVPANVVLCKGLFSDTIDQWTQAHPDKVGFLHMDCDLYSSTRDVLHRLKDRFQKGSVIVFDEYFNYPSWRRHEAKAWWEFVAEFSIKYRYIAFSALKGVVAVEIEEI